MKDRAMLVLVACVLAALSWCFWAGVPAIFRHFLAPTGNEVFFQSLASMVFALTAIDNVRLRRQLQTLQTNARS